MAHAETVFKENFIEYASYVIKDRAIPDIVDGLKPVQRRILHALFEMDDGKFHKVANVVGSCMKYHPHGDASIGDALVNLANAGMFIDRQGNFGNVMTGDDAAAPRYIECRILPFAKKVLYNPELTEMVDSYDGRNTEPVSFPAKIPVVLVQGAEGIAVGMSTRILPHNLIEVLDALASVLKGESFELFPDFITGGFMDVSGYADGTGKVLVRAKLNTSDPKRIIIEELPFGVTTEKMIKSIEDAARKGRIKIASISDFTTDKANIEITLARNTYSNEVVDALYGYTACEQSISVNPLVIKENVPCVMPVSEIVHYHAKHLVDVLDQELRLEKKHLLERLHARTLERIFVEERLYKRIEQKRSQEEVEKAVISGFKPFEEQLLQPVTTEDVERLLKIPIRRISLFDIEKNRAEIETINARMQQIDWDLAHIVEYALTYLEDLKKLSGVEEHARRTQIGSFRKVDIREVANRDLSMKYDPETGYLGYGLKTGNLLMMVSTFDRLLVVQKEGTYFVTDAPEKLFVGKNLRHCDFADKETLEKTVFTIIYQEKTLKYLFIKRCRITQFIMNKTYELLPSDKFKLYTLSTLDDARVTIIYKPAKGYKILEDRTYFSRFLVKGVKAAGVRLSTKETQTVRLKHEADPKAGDTEPSLFGDTDPFDDDTQETETDE